ncbi:MAG: hypothetical protein AAF253_14375, partial [Pseudomonadota bacterium]
QSGQAKPAFMTRVALPIAISISVATTVEGTVWAWELVWPPKSVAPIQRGRWRSRHHRRRRRTR